MVTVYKFVDKKLNIGTAYIGTPNMLKRFGNFHPLVLLLLFHTDMILIDTNNLMILIKIW